MAQRIGQMDRKPPLEITKQQEAVLRAMPAGQRGIGINDLNLLSGVEAGILKVKIGGEDLVGHLMELQKRGLANYERPGAIRREPAGDAFLKNKLPRRDQGPDLSR